MAQEGLQLRMAEKVYYQGQNYKLWWDETNQIGRAWARGQLDVEIAQFFAKALKEIYHQYGEVPWCLDISEIQYPPQKARQILAEAHASIDTGRFAFVGASIMIRTVVNSIANASGKTNTRHFATESKALPWLQEDMK